MTSVAMLVIFVLPAYMPMYGDTPEDRSEEENVAR